MYLWTPYSIQPSTMLFLEGEEEEGAEIFYECYFLYMHMDVYG